MKQTTVVANKMIESSRHSQTTNNAFCGGGLRMRTDLRAGLAWDDLDDQAKELWSNLTSSLGNLTGSTDAS
ncbi:MAG: hypothetical protein R2911_44820 [Caldilineaceae bacterium]